jgi:hypothetical protein
MSEATQPTPNEPAAGSERDPLYWRNAFDGSPISIVVPPYIRFLQGQIALRRSLAFLVAARKEAQSGNPRLLPLFESLNSSPEAKQAELSYESVFASTGLISLVSEVEHFFGNAVATALRLYPGKMGSQTFRLSEILSATTTDELVDRAASSVMHELMYEKPLDYLSGLCEILSIKKDSLSQPWLRFVEIKARRDLGVHNNWVANQIYLRKIKEAQHTDLPALGVRLIPDFAYLQTAMNSTDELIRTMADLLGEKWIPVARRSPADRGQE